MPSTLQDVRRIPRRYPAGPEYIPPNARANNTPDRITRPHSAAVAVRACSCTATGAADRQDFPITRTGTGSDRGQGSAAQTLP